MNHRSLLSILLFVVFIHPAFAQKQNGKVTIDIEKGGVEKGKIKNGQREGTWKAYNSKGHQIQEENFKGGKRNGTFWRETDSLTTTGSYKAGSKDGRFTSTISGRVVSEIDYRMDTLQGRYYVATSEKKITCEYSHGKKTGLCVVDSFNYEKQHINDSTHFTNGLRDGSSSIYVNGKLSTRTQWIKGKRNGAYTEYDAATGRVFMQGTYVDDKRTGTWRKYEGGKLVRVEHYENGNHSANTISYGSDTTIVIQTDSYYPTGQLRSVLANDEQGHRSSSMYYNALGNMDSSISYYPSGRIHESHYTSFTNKDGATQFYLYESYYANGKMAIKGYKHRMLKSGTWLLYDSLGKLQTSITYSENIPFGWFTAYHPNGKTKLRAYCYDAITDTILVYDNNGTRVSQSSPAYSKTIAEIQAKFPEITFRDPNTFPADHKRKGIVALGDSITGEGKWSDVPATYPGGKAALDAFIKRTIHYPEPERRLSKEGEVRIKFLIEDDGTISDIQIIQTVAGAPGFTKETMRLMRVMPKWTPATTKGKVVKVYYTLPVKFSLQ